MSAKIQIILIRVLALVAFVAINVIGLKAFSAEESSLPVCQIASEGYVESQWKKIRIQIDDAVVAGAETLSGLGTQLAKLVNEHKCLPSPVPCSFAATRLGVNALANHQIIVSEAVQFSARTTAKVFEQMAQLKNMGVCE